MGTGLKMDIPPSLEGQIRTKSGIAHKHGVFVLNSPGTIDPDYRGEVKVLLQNAGDQPYFVKAGQKIAQLVICPRTICWPRLNPIPFVEVDSISDATPRGTGGFGSTGV